MDQDQIVEGDRLLVKRRNPVLVAAIVLAQVVMIFYLYIELNQSQHYLDSSIAITVDPIDRSKVKSDTPPSTNISGKPTRLVIPSLSIDASIEPVGLTKKNTVALPKTKFATGWYELGVKPGEVGNSVVIGHSTAGFGQKEIFFKLNSVVQGNEIEVVYDTNQIVKFRVIKIVSYPYDNFPSSLIFGASDGRNLNLVTCEGDYLPTKGIYSRRLVVFSESID